MHGHLPEYARDMTVLRRILLLLLCLPMAAHSGASDAPLTVFAAASLKTALDEVSEGWDGKVVLSYGGSGTIARQVAMGAPADVVGLANTAWMGWLEEQGVLAGRPEPLLGNALVVIAEAGAADMAPAELPARLGDGRLAIGHTMSVPAGIYGKAWLERSGLWREVAPRLAETENVRAALALVARQETPLGIVYASDAMAEPRVSVVFQIPAADHPAISYLAAVTTSAQQDGAGRFLDYLKSDEAAEIFHRHGFLPPPESE
jgi:molybdate transport system substrate-binding protein